MSQCLHTENIFSSADVYTQQFAITAGLWHNERMKLRLKSLRVERHLTIDQLADLSFFPPISERKQNMNSKSTY